MALESSVWRWRVKEKAMVNFNRRTFDWRKPILSSVVDFLVERYVNDDQFDLGSVVAVFPSGVAARRLLQRLVLLSDAKGWSFVPPQISTVGGLPELLYEPKRPFAESEVQLLAWQQALQTLDANELLDLMSKPPEPDDFFGWQDLAQLMQALHRELASDILSFKDVIRVGSETGDFPDRRRWELLEKVQLRYLARLDELGYWDRQTARSMAIQFGECHSDREILLIGAVDLNGSMRAMLDQVASQVTLLQFGDPTHDASFDRHGCLQLSEWEVPEIRLDSVELIVADSPDDQAIATLQFFEQCDSSLSYDALTVGVPNETLVPYLLRHAESYELLLHDSAGRALGQLPIGLWFQSLLDWIESRSYAALAVLVRHPVVFSRLSERLGGATWLNALDDYHRQHLPALMTGTYGDRSGVMVGQLLSAIDQWCSPVTNGKERPVSAWGTAWLECLSAWWGDQWLDRDDPLDRQTLTGLSKLRDALGRFEQLPNGIQPQVKATHALRWAIRQVQGDRVAGLPPADAVPMLGWLDLPWDDGTHVVVCGFNEGVVPSSEKHDLFLPNSLRQRLGIMHSSRRFARDAYYLSLLIHGKQKLRLVAGRRTAENDPLVPSRLLFHDRPEVVVKRALECFDQPAKTFRLASPEESLAAEDKSPEPEFWGLPIPVTPEQPWSLSPTDFGRYLRCPYRFYLSKYLKLRTIDDQETELGPGEFGDLLHEVLKRFGKSKVKDSEQAEVIAKQLSVMLDDVVRERYEHSHLPAIDLQIEHARRRLLDFSKAQAEWAAAGWRIQEVEQSDIAMSLGLESGDVTIRGRFDRLDYHPDEGRWMLLDYKSSDAGLSPEETHLRKKNEWIDLQLPMYYWMLRNSDPSKQNLGVGYIVLSRDSDKNGFKITRWDDAIYQSALAEAERIASSIFAGEFWPPTDISTREQRYDDFSSILTLPRMPQDSV